jgi:signal transduction histidine kinase
MSSDAAVAEATPWRLLPPAAVGHLAHDLRGAIHVIRGHAELLRAEAADEPARESACYIVDASLRLAAMCEDVIEFLRLPAITRGEPIALALDDITQSVSRLAEGRGIQLRAVEQGDTRASVWVDPSVRRVVTHVLTHSVRSASSDVTIAATLGASGESMAIAVWPVPVEAEENNDGIVALAAELLAARGGHLSVSGHRMELSVPLVGSGA